VLFSDLSVVALQKVLNGESIEPELNCKYGNMVNLVSTDDPVQQGNAFSIYAETSSMFIKTFHPVVLRDSSPSSLFFYVIVLRRGLAQTVCSQHRKGWLTPMPEEVRWTSKGSSGFVYTLEEGQATCLVKPLAPDAELDQVDKLIGYNLDIEAKAQKFIASNQNTPNMKILEITLEDLNSVEGTKKLFEELEFNPNLIYLEALGRKLNESKKDDPGEAVDYYEERIRQYYQECKNKSVALPEYHMKSIMAKAAVSPKPSSLSSRKRKK